MDEFIQDYGIVPVFGFVAIVLSWYARSLWQLCFVLSTVCVAFLLISRFFSMNLDSGLFDITIYTQIMGDSGDINFGPTLIFASGFLTFLLKKVIGFGS